MKFYISAKWDLHEVVKEIQDYLLKEGHEIIVDWTKRAFARNYSEDKEQSISFSKEEVNAILNSDVFIHLSDLGGKGKYVDLGVAITGNKLKGTPKIYVVGKGVNESQFYFYPSVNRIISEDIMKSLKFILNDLKN